MKNAMLVLMLCLGVTACLDNQSAPTDDPSATTASDDTASQSQTAQQVTGHELDPSGPTANSCFIGSGPCIDQTNTHTCNFRCCDGASGSVRTSCSFCLGAANDFCQNGRGGTLTASWTN